ncbi:MAG: nicotinate-nucleotide adenylyltransferase [Prevotellaceae bacterium]|jgi:nicotinate-nucleotide adenylyltransferase|nr:nicotinate-nucleotide adenylyltransferase [Prevotellaceae bacterium]
MIALFFGSFNPIHRGHTALAHEVLQQCGVSEVWFVVSPHNPLKQSGELWSESLRLRLVELAIANEARFKACTVEFELPKPNFTINTLRRLNELYPNEKFALVIGADNLAVFDRWRDYQTILDHYSVFVYPREGIDSAYWHRQYPQTQLIDAPLFPISSTEIRKRLHKGECVKDFLDERVYKEIKKYRNKAL